MNVYLILFVLIGFLPLILIRYILNKIQIGKLKARLILSATAIISLLLAVIMLLTQTEICSGMRYLTLGIVATTSGIALLIYALVVMLRT